MGEQDKECRCPPSSLPADLQAFPRIASHQSRKTRASLENKGKAGPRSGSSYFSAWFQVSKKCYSHCDMESTQLCLHGF